MVWQGLTCSYGLHLGLVLRSIEGRLFSAPTRESRTRQSPYSRGMATWGRQLHSSSKALWVPRKDQMVDVITDASVSVPIAALLWLGQRTWSWTMGDKIDTFASAVLKFILHVLECGGSVMHVLGCRYIAGRCFALRHGVKRDSSSVVRPV